jgi:hypothetical protein
MPKILAAVLVIPFITLAVASTASAQVPNEGNPTILSAVQHLQSSVDALATQVANISNLGGNVTTKLTEIANQLTGLTNTVNALGTPPTVVSTGFSFKPTGYSAACLAQNVGTSPVTVTLELRSIDGVLQQNVLNLALGPGQGSGFSQSITSSASR